MGMLCNITPALSKSPLFQNIVIRSSNIEELAAAAREIERERLMGLQIISLLDDPKPLESLSEPIRLDLVIRSAHEFSSIYRFADLARLHPMRLTVPVTSGFVKAVRLALSLNIPVKLEVSQPNAEMIDELVGLAEFYLYHQTVSIPMEFFHSLLLGFYLEDPVSLWKIQEEDPAAFCYFDETGKNHFSRRLEGHELPQEVRDYITGDSGTLPSVLQSCQDCKYLKSCAGYFKFPSGDYDCSGIRELFGIFMRAALELKKTYQSMK